MTTVLAAFDARTAAPAPRRRERLHGLLWLNWRQNRTLAWVLLAFVLLVAALVGWCVHGLDAAAGPQHLTRACAGGGAPTMSSPACGNFLIQQEDYVSVYQSIVQRLLLLFPVLIGMFVGAPLLSREYERRTQLLAWGQSVSPRRWLAARLGCTAALVLVAGAAVAALSEWFWQQYVVPSGLDSYAFHPTTYAAIGAVPAAYALYALVLGAVVGLVLRSAVVSVLVTGVLTGASTAAGYLLRPHLLPLTRQVQSGVGSYVAPANAWVVDHGVILANGSRVSVSADCDSTACQNSHTFYGVYQPASHFWPLQLVESGVLLVLAAALVGFAFAWLRSGRD